MTVTLTLNDTNATIEYLDASNMTLDDTDTLATGQQVALAVGDNVIKVKVTASDRTTTQTYAVTVNRPEFPTIDTIAVTSTPLLETDTYGEGETIEISVTFNEAVNATDDTDIVLFVGGPRHAPLLRGSGTATLVFGYTVQAETEPPPASRSGTRTSRRSAARSRAWTRAWRRTSIIPGSPTSPATRWTARARVRSSRWR